MTKLEKSIRHEMAHYGVALRSGKYWANGTSGTLPNGFRGFFETAHCDYDSKNGIVSDIRIYVYGDAKEERDYYGRATDISDPIEAYIRNEAPWDDMIAGIVEIVREGR